MLVAGMEKDSASLRNPPALAKATTPFCAEQTFLLLSCSPAPLPCYPWIPPHPHRELCTLLCSCSVCTEPVQPSWLRSFSRAWQEMRDSYQALDILGEVSHRFVEHQPCSHSSQGRRISLPVCDSSDLVLYKPSCSACHGLVPLISETFFLTHLSLCDISCLILSILASAYFCFSAVSLPAQKFV